MNPRTTGILFLVTAAIAAFVYFYEIEGQEARDRAVSDAKLLFPGVESDAISEIDLTTNDAQLVHLVRNGDGWQLDQPLVFPADEFAVDAIASALAGLSSERALSDPQSASVYGLDAAGSRITFRVSRGDASEEHAVEIGRSSPVGGNSYVSVVGDDSVHLVRSTGVNSFRKSLQDLRRKRIVDFDPESIDRLEIDLVEGRVVAERVGGEWSLVEPRREAADEEAIDDLLSTLSFLRAEAFIDTPGEADFAGFEPPDYRARLVARASDPPRTLEIAIGQRSEDGNRLVRTESPSLFQISSEQMLELPQTPLEFRFRSLAKFDSWKANRVEILFQDGESVAITATKADGGWTSEPEAIDPEKLRSLVSRLGNLRASSILAESVGEAESAGLKLDPPRVTYRVYGPVGDTSDTGELDSESETAAAEPAETLLAEVFIGEQRGSSGVVAQRAGAEKVFEIELAAAEQIPVSLDALRNRFLAEPTPTAADPADEAATAPEEIPAAALP